jgi:hypothetical protein
MIFCGPFSRSRLAGDRYVALLTGQDRSPGAVVLKVCSCEHTFALLELERAKAKERQGERTDLTSCSHEQEVATDQVKGPARDIVAEAVGFRSCRCARSWPFSAAGAC